jgi:hypothetical protein
VTVAETIRTTADRALEAYAALAELGEDVEDEWSYVNDLAEVWRAELIAVADRRGREEVPAEVGAAVDRAIAEIGLITDPNRAIDWLSTFPQVVLVALGERP